MAEIDPYHVPMFRSGETFLSHFGSHPVTFNFRGQEVIDYLLHITREGAATAKDLQHKKLQIEYEEDPFPTVVAVTPDHDAFEYFVVAILSFVKSMVQRDLFTRRMLDYICKLTSHHHQIELHFCDLFEDIEV